MNNIIRFFNQNKVTVYTIIAVVIFAIMVIQILNQAAKDQNQRELNNIANTIIDNYSEQGAVGGTSIALETIKANNNIVKEFINYCNNKNYGSAYELLTQECKDAVFPTIDDFKNDYCDKLFTEEKKYTADLWMNQSYYTTYKVQFSNDILATGGYNTSSTFEDYYTIEKESLKLNINGFVYTEIMNESTTKNNVKMTILERKNFIDYQQYKISIENSNNTELKIYNYENSKWYISDSNNFEYEAYINEITNNDINIPANATATITMKFAKVYSLTRKINSISFKNIEINNNGQITQFTISIDMN